MAPTIEPTGATLGAIVTAVDRSRLDDSVWSVLEDAFHEFGVLIFPGQHLSAGAQIAFGERFGEISDRAQPSRWTP